jgi:hypothetical protein
MKILVEGRDHSYEEYNIVEMKVVRNRKTGDYYEYVGDDHLEEWEEVVLRHVAC